MTDTSRQQVRDAHPVQQQCCPACETVTTDARVIITYESRGELRGYGACAGCGSVVALRQLNGRSR